MKIKSVLSIVLLVLLASCLGKKDNKDTIAESGSETEINIINENINSEDAEEAIFEENLDIDDIVGLYLFREYIQSEYQNAADTIVFIQYENDQFKVMSNYPNEDNDISVNYYNEIIKDSLLENSPNDEYKYVFDGNIYLHRMGDIIKYEKVNFSITDKYVFSDYEILEEKDMELNKNELNDAVINIIDIEGMPGNYIELYLPWSDFSKHIIKKIDSLDGDILNISSDGASSSTYRRLYFSENIITFEYNYARSYDEDYSALMYIMHFKKV